MAALGVTYPIKAGSIRGCIHITSVANTDWNTLTSVDFKDSVGGASCAAGLRFVWIGVVNLSSSAVYFKYRAAAGAGDTTTDELIIPARASIDDDIGTLRDTVTQVAFKKGASDAEVFILAGFDIA